VNQPSEAPETPISTPPTGLRVLQTGFLIAGSALLGGLAVAFWNRKSLAKLRQPVNPASVQEDVETE
jgi:hypothetical protein